MPGPCTFSHINTNSNAATATAGPGPLQHLIKCNVDTREPDRQKNTPLHIACLYGRTKNVELLLSSSQYSNIKCKNREGNSPLHLAAMYGHLECVKLLIEKGLKIALPGNSQQRILHFAAANNHEELARWILENKGRVNCTDKFKRSPLIHAVKNGNLRMASILLQNGADFNQPDSSNNYPIHYAAAYGFQECVDLLVQAGADLNAVNSWNLSALCVAMQKNHFGCVKQLVGFEKTDVNCKDDQGRTMISLSLDSLDEEMLERIKFLIDKKADCNIADVKGLTPLIYACKMKAESIVQFHPDWPDQQQQNHYQPYGRAQPVQEDNEEVKAQKAKCIRECTRLIEQVIELFLSSGADINKAGLEAQTPFSVAFDAQNYNIVNILLENKKLDLLSVRTTDQGNVYHLLAKHVNEKECYGVFEKVYAQVENKNNVLNQMDNEGFVPILRMLTNFNFYGDLLIQQPENRLIDKFFELMDFLTKKAGVDITLKVGKLLKYRQMQEKQSERKKSSSSKDKQKDSEMQIEEQKVEDADAEAEVPDADAEEPDAEAGEESAKVDEEADATEYEEEDVPEEANDEANDEENEENEEDPDDLKYDEVAELNQKENDPYCAQGLQNAWHIALAHGCSYDRIVPWLQQFNGLSINEQDKLERTPLHIVCQFHHPKIQLLDNKLNLQELLDLGAIKSINTKDVSLSTPLMYLIKFQLGSLADQLVVLLKNGATAEYQNKERLTPVIQAVHQKKYEFIEPLVNAGADLNQTFIEYKKVKDKNGQEKEEIDTFTIPLI